MLPKLRSTNHPGMQLIRPLYSVSEEAICSWRDYNGLEFLQCACRFTEKAAQDEKLSKRHEVKMLLKELKKDNPMVCSNIFNAIHNVCLDTFCEYKEGNVRHTFNEIFDSKQNLINIETEKNYD
jgi:tRNA(Ile)-lysidine synthase TilS/MesJ